MISQIWKAQSKFHMEQFLRSRGWPWIWAVGMRQQHVNDNVMRLLPEMFRSLDRANLIPNGFTYQQFYKAAYDKYMAAKESK